MDLSIIVTSYNLENYISRCLCSILPQLTSKCELIIIDDYSTDRTVDKINQCMFVHNKKCKVVVNDINKGVSYSRNAGLALATGNYVAFIDGDDEVTTDYIKVILNNLPRKNDIFLISWKTTCANHFEYKSDNLPAWNTAVWCRIWKRSIIKHTFNEDKSWAEDKQFIEDNITDKHIIGYITPTIYLYRNDRPGSLTERATAGFTAKEQKLVKLIFYSPRFVMGGMETVVYNIIWFLLRTGKYDIKLLYEDNIKSSKKMMDKYRKLCDVELVKDNQSKIFVCDALINCTYTKLNLSFVKANKTIHALYSNIPIEIANLFNANNVIIAQSKWHKDKLMDVGLNSTIITNAVDINAINALATEPCERFNVVEDNNITYLMVCRISIEKGFDKAIEFMSREYNLKNKLVIVGSPFNTADKHLQDEVSAALGDRVTFIGEKENPFPCIKAADYLCSFSDHELYGLATEEAHILGTPVIFSHYETAQDQFIEGFDQWIDEFIPVKRTHAVYYDDSKNAASVKLWEDIISAEQTHFQKVNFYAQAVQYIDHMIPVWQALPEEYRGIFYINPDCAERAKAAHIPVVHTMPRPGLTLVAAYDDYMQTVGPVIWMDHGIGNTYGNDNPYYAGGPGKDRVVLFLNPHQMIQNKNAATYPKAKQVIVGTPKLDNVEPNIPMKKDKKTVCLSFHWNCEVAPETRSAFPHYESILHTLAASDDFNLIFHGHPREDKHWDEVCAKYKITRVKNLKDVFEQADVYICDNSSTIYEFAATGRPVIVLNAPWYRKGMRLGIRFWDYIPGPQVDDPKDLYKTILKMLKDPTDWQDMRNKIVRTLYPLRGQAAQKAADTIVSYIKGEL